MVFTAQKRFEWVFLKTFKSITVIKSVKLKKCFTNYFT